MPDDLPPLTIGMRQDILIALEQGWKPPELMEASEEDAEILARIKPEDADAAAGERRRIKWLNAALAKPLGPQFRAWLGQMLAEEML